MCVTNELTSLVTHVTRINKIYLICHHNSYGFNFCYRVGAILVKLNVCGPIVRTNTPTQQKFILRCIISEVKFKETCVLYSGEICNTVIYNLDHLNTGLEIHQCSLFKSDKIFFCFKMIVKCISTPLKV